MLLIYYTQQYNKPNSPLLSLCEHKGIQTSAWDWHIHCQVTQVARSWWTASKVCCMCKPQCKKTRGGSSKAMVGIPNIAPRQLEHFWELNHSPNHTVVTSTTETSPYSTDFSLFCFVFSGSHQSPLSMTADHCQPSETGLLLNRELQQKNSTALRLVWGND